jgi:uncharacterized protein (TIGR03118 family)
MLNKFKLYLASSIALLLLTACGGNDNQNNGSSSSAPKISTYKSTILVANKAEYNPQILDTNLTNAWGIAIRPAGLGGHFWVPAGSASFQYVGDVKNSSDSNLHNLHVDSLPYVSMGLDEGATSTGTVFNGGSSFVITQPIEGKSDIIAPTKFFFASDDGSIHAWTERKVTNIDGSTSMDWPTVAVPVIKHVGASYFGIAMNTSFTRLYAANFGLDPEIHVYDGTFKKLDVKFETPFDLNGNGKVDIGEYAPFNIQNIIDQYGNHHLLVAYAETKECSQASINNGICKAGEIEPGEEAGEVEEEGEEEEESSGGSGRIAEFDDNGKLIANWDSTGLSSPWGVAFAPSNFGQYSGHLLVANFGTGLISVYHPTTRKFVDFLRDSSNNYIYHQGIWGLQFGNGASLGDSNALYFTAGPRDEQDGVFGSIRLNQ